MIGPIELLIIVVVLALFAMGGFAVFTWLLQGYNDAQGYSDTEQSTKTDTTDE